MISHVINIFFWQMYTNNAFEKFVSVETKRMERKKTSWVWQYFEKDPRKRFNEREKYVLCKVDTCDDRSVKTVGGNTSLMAHHLRKEHRILPPLKADARDSGEMTRLVAGDQKAIDQKLYASPPPYRPQSNLTY